MDKVKGPKMAGFPSRMANSGTIVQAPRQSGVMDEAQKSYISKDQGDFDSNLKKIKSGMCKESM